MISPGKFNISIGEAKKLLNELKLLKGVAPHTVGQYSDEFFKICRCSHHIDTYNTIRDNLDYDIILKDDSFFQFAANKNYLRYCYIENPNFTYSKAEYLKEIFSDLSDDEIDEKNIMDLVKEEEYEQYLNEAELNLNLIYIRYDFDLKGYTPLLHSCSHIHIGMRESLRIPLSTIITPLQFVVFCVKFAYPDHWNNFYKASSDKYPIHQFLKSIKNQNLNINPELWNEIEESELFIS